jgi:hypothetical protein
VVRDLVRRGPGPSHPPWCTVGAADLELAGDGNQLQEMAKPIDLEHKISLPWPDRVGYRKEEARRYEAGRLREIDDKRWNKLCEFAANWEQRDRFLVSSRSGEARPRRRRHHRRGRRLERLYRMGKRTGQGARSAPSGRSGDVRYDFKGFAMVMREERHTDASGRHPADRTLSRKRFLRGG